MSSKVFFTADTHFDHRGLLRVRTQFESVEAMNEHMIEKWNSVVTSGDRVYHLGDFALGRPETAAEIGKRLNGQIYLILGNHDKVAEHKLVRDRFVWLKDYFYLKVGEQSIALSHYAFRVWRNSHHGSWHLHGHSHGSLEDLPSARSFDVGVDCWDFTPITFEQVTEKMATKTWKPIDHHGDGGLAEALEE